VRGALKLLGKVVAGQLPPQALTYSMLNKLNAWLAPGSKRFEFERLYLEKSDPWDFVRSSYEQQKYERILARILRFRSGSQAVLEIACSIGIFTKMLSAQFREVVAIDVAQGAISSAEQYCRLSRNIKFLRCDLRDLRLRRRFDVIVCAEVLYYVREDHAPQVCRIFRDHISPGGIIVLVGDGGDRSMFWEARLRTEFEAAQEENVNDPDRPYRIAVFKAAAQR
jgi:2-polyprenyl-3-methyl-5-hydroxy-6-metoxy-1,4-benzoquinol methylase